MKHPPSQLVQDDDGHWYLVPEAKITRFHDILSMDVDDPAAWKAFEPFTQYAVDGPHRLRILAWEEMT